MLKCEYMELIHAFNNYPRDWDGRYQMLASDAFDNITRADITLNPYIFLSARIKGIPHPLIGI